jgi:hypothetical protein
VEEMTLKDMANQAQMVRDTKAAMSFVKVRLAREAMARERNTEAQLESQRRLV